MGKGCHRGSIEVIVGPMFAGKSTELLRKVSRLRYAEKRILLIKHGLDDRFSKLDVVSRLGVSSLAVPCFSTQECRKHFEESDYDVVLIDEVQFFNLDLVDYLVELADSGIEVIVAGLDNDHLRMPWPVMTRLISIAERVQKLKAICALCKEDASFTFRKVRTKRKRLIGDYESYDARCRGCWIKGFKELHQGEDS